jgi:phosphoserine aminotransferase
MSSDILSRPIDVSAFGMIYAGAQKNIGPSGIVVNIVREDLLGAPVRCARPCSTTRSRPITARCTTPRHLAWYLSGLVFEWLKEQGGVEAMGKLNEVKKRTAVRLHRRQRPVQQPDQRPFVDERAVPPG